MSGISDGAAAPDTFGLQEYFVTDVAVETAGGNVRMVCGVRRGGQVHWLYSCIMPAERLLPVTQTCAKAACEAFNLTQLMDRRGKSH